MESGKMEIGSEILLRIGREFANSVEWLLRGRLDKQIYEDCVDFQTARVHTNPYGLPTAKTVDIVSVRSGHRNSCIAIHPVVASDPLLKSGPFLLAALNGRLYPIRPFPAWFLLPLPGEFVAFHRRIPLSSAFENPQGFGAIGTATPFLKILLGTQSRNLFRHGHIDQLV